MAECDLVGGRQPAHLLARDKVLSCLDGVVESIDALIQGRGL